MHRLATILVIALASISPSTAERAAMAVPPVAKISDTVLIEHGRQRVDPYYWLRDRNDPSVLAYLSAENDYAAERLAPLRPLIAKLDHELRERADGAEVSPLFSDNRFIYRRRLAKGASLPVIVRGQNSPGASEHVVIDFERLAAGHRYYDLGDYTISPDGGSLAFTVDFNGGRLHRVFIRNIATGETVEAGVENASSDLVFSSDSKWLFYVRADTDSKRPYQLWRHELGTPSSQDRLVYEESDPAFDLQLSRSKSGRFILLTSNHSQTTEVRYLPAADPAASLRVMEPRQQGVIYAVDHVGDTFYLRTNLGAPDFRLVRAPEAAPHAANWAEVIGETPGRLISEFELFESFVALVEESNAIQSVRVVRFADNSELKVPVPADIGVAETGFTHDRSNHDAASTKLRLRFSGPRHPQATYDFDTVTGTLTLHKRSPAAAKFNPDAYEVKRLAVAAPDGEEVPVTVMYRKDLMRPGQNPALITGYGAYGSSTSPEFPETWLSLIDRGFVFAQAHVRGGQEKGARWYGQGRVLNKPNTFNDFIAATEALIAQGYADPLRVFSQGASAGGLMVAVAAQRRPDLYAGVVAEVPFVDVMTTMSDPSLPLTTQEYEEWGNPAIREHYDSMMSYSPYDNVTAQAYPPMLVTAALHDSQVGFHEPAKWVARLRAMKTDSNELLLLTSMHTGHTGEPGRFGGSEESAKVMAWLLAQAGKLD